MSGGLGPVNNTWIIIGVICGVFGLGIIIFFVYMACQKWKNRTTEAIPVVQSTYLEKRKTLDMSDNNNIRRGIPESVYSTAGAAPMMPPQSFKPGSTPSPLTPPPAVPRIPTLPRTPSLPRKMSNKGTLGTMSDGRASFNEVDGFNKMPSADMGFNDKFSVADTTDVIRMRVIDNYPAQMADELTLDLNDVVLADQTFDDGWALGKNVTKGTIGAFPLACCVPVGEDDNQDMQPPPPQRGKANVYSRTSSLFTSKR